MTELREIKDFGGKVIRTVVTRPGWHEYFLGIARAVAERAECTRRQVGAVVVKDRRIRSTGYNGAPAGHPSCLKGACPRGQSDVPHGSSYDTGAGACIALHAEQNALLWASRDDREGGILYVTCKPCAGCWRTIQGSGIKFVVYVSGPDPSLWWVVDASEPYSDLPD